MKKLIREHIKPIIFFILAIVAIGIFVGITVKKQNDKNKNTVVFVLDDLYYNNVYKGNTKDINKVLKKHYARSVVVTYSLYRFSYDELEQKIKDAVETSFPTHIVFSPITALNLYKSNASSDIGLHSRGRARLVSLSKIERTELFDTSYRESSDYLYSLMASLINAQSEKVSLIFNNDKKEDPMFIEELRSKIAEDVFYLDEGIREQGSTEANELYTSLLEKDIKIIASLGFKNMTNLADIIAQEKSDMLFILPEILKGNVPSNELGATIDLDFPLLLDKILDDVEITEKTTLGDNTIPLKINIRNKRIKPIMSDEREETNK